MNRVHMGWTSYINQQHRSPTGVIGSLIGERMRRQHAPETAWSVGLLHLQPTDQVLEIGFGVGQGLRLSVQATPHGHVTGVDRSPTMLRAAARRNRLAIARGQLSLMCGDLTTLPFVGSCFDKLFSIHTFYFWPDPQALCTQLVQLLGPGGRLVSTFATARKRSSGDWQYWEVQQQAETLVAALGEDPNLTTTLLIGPNSRAFNNVALVIDKA